MTPFEFLVAGWKLSMLFNCMLPLEGKSCVRPVRRSGKGSRCERLKLGDDNIMHKRAYRRLFEFMFLML